MRNLNYVGVTVASSALTSAVKKVLHPLVGFLMDNGLTYPWLIKILKSTYIDVANKEFKLPEKQQTDSRISLITGIHRKDIKRFREEQNQSHDTPENVLLGARLIAKWNSDENFCNENGETKALTRLASNTNKGDSFEELVSTVNKDIRPRAILDEWLRLGIIDIDENDYVHLKEDAFIPSHGYEEKIYYLGKNVHDHLAAARINTQSNKPPFLERSVYYDELTEESIEQLSKIAKEEAIRTLKILNKEASKLQLKDKAVNCNLDAKLKLNHCRMNFGFYFYNEKED